MLIFKDKNSKDVKFFPPPKNENNILINTMKDSKEKKLIDKSLKNNSIKIKINKENSINFKNKNIKNKENNKLVKMENEINSKRKLNSLDEDNSINIEIPLDNKNNNKIDTTRGTRGKQLIFSPIVNIEAPLINILQNTQNNIFGKKKEIIKKEKLANCIILEHMNESNNDKLYNIKSNYQRELEKIKEISRIKDEFNKKSNIKNNRAIKKVINNLETIEEKNEEKNNKEDINLYQTDEDLQDMDYEEAIIYDKRSFLRMYWSFLVDTQIILGTFYTDNYLNLFVIKFSFFIFTFQISFFLNAFFYTDEYISDAYHNDGVLDFVTGLPKAIYSLIATLITKNAI